MTSHVPTVASANFGSTPRAFPVRAPLSPEDEAHEVLREALAHGELATNNGLRRAMRVARLWTGVEMAPWATAQVGWGHWRAYGVLVVPWNVIENRDAHEARRLLDGLIVSLADVCLGQLEQARDYFGVEALTVHADAFPAWLRRRGNLSDAKPGHVPGLELLLHPDSDAYMATLGCYYRVSAKSSELAHEWRSRLIEESGNDRAWLAPPTTSDANPEGSYPPPPGASVDYTSAL